MDFVAIGSARLLRTVEDARVRWAVSGGRLSQRSFSPVGKKKKKKRPRWVQFFKAHPLPRPPPLDTLYPPPAVPLSHHLPSPCLTRSTKVPSALTWVCRPSALNADSLAHSAQVPPTPALPTMKAPMSKSVRSANSSCTCDAY